MAQLQGYFLMHKDDPQAALDDIQKRAISLASQIPSSSHPSPPQSTQFPSPPSQSSGGSQRRRITAHELDKMPFNPQFDWEQNLTQQKK
jgi:hypothetical protein